MFVYSHELTRVCLSFCFQHNILAAPVRDVTCTAPNPQWHELFLGLFSMTDAVFAALRLEEVRGVSFFCACLALWCSKSG